MNLAEARQAVADLLNAVPDLAVRTKPMTGALKPGDGWVSTRRIGPGPRFGTGVVATVEALVIAGSDEPAAEDFSDAHATQVLRAVEFAPELGATEVSVVQQVVLVGTNSTPLYSLVLTATIEVEQPQ